MESHPKALERATQALVGCSLFDFLQIPHYRKNKKKPLSKLTELLFLFYPKEVYELLKPAGWTDEQFAAIQKAYQEALGTDTGK